MHGRDRLAPPNLQEGAPGERFHAVTARSKWLFLDPERATMALDRIAPSIYHQCQSSLSAARQLSSILRSVYGRYRRLRAKCPQKHFWTARVYTRNLNIDFLCPLGCEQALLGGFEITNFFGGSMFLSPRYSPPKSLPKHAKFASRPSFANRPSGSNLCTSSSCAVVPWTC